MIGLALLPSACDTLEDDVAPASDLSAISDDINAIGNTYSSTGDTVLIDLLRGLEASQNVRIALEKAPSKGTAELLDAGTLRYVPFPDFTTGKDWLVVALSSGTSSRKDTIEVVMNPMPDTVVLDTMRVDSAFRCTDLIVRNDSIVLSDSISPFDYGVYYLDVLANDQLCSLSYQLTLSADNPALVVENNQIRYTSPGQKDISFSYNVCLLDYDACQGGQVDVRFASCEPYLLPDSVTVKRNGMISDTVSINVRWNDQVCGDDSVRIYQQPATGQAWVENNYIIYRYPAAPEVFNTSLIYGYGVPPPASDNTDGRQATVYIKVEE